MNLRNTDTILIMLVIIVIASVILGNNIEAFPDIDMSDFDAGKIVSLVGSLFFLSLLVERFVEIFVADPEKGEKDKMEDKIKKINNDLQALKENPEAVVTSNFALSSNRKISKGDSVELKVEKLAAEKNEEAEALKKMKVRRGKIMKITTFTVGLLLALFGIRVLTDLISAPLDESLQKTYINIVDMILTAGLIAGGSEGIHSIIKTLKNFTETPKT